MYSDLREEHKRLALEFSYHSRLQYQLLEEQFDQTRDTILQFTNRYPKLDTSEQHQFYRTSILQMGDLRQEYATFTQQHYGEEARFTQKTAKVPVQVKDLVTQYAAYTLAVPSWLPAERRMFGN